MSELQQYIDRYEEHHRNPVNKAIHWVAVPLIMFSLLGLVWMIPFPRITTFLNWASFVIAFSIYYYWTLSRPMAIAMLLLTSVMSYFIVRIELTARSEEHTSELPSLMRISYAVFCLKKKQIIYTYTNRESPI